MRHSTVLTAVISRWSVCGHMNNTAVGSGGMLTKDIRLTCYTDTCWPGLMRTFTATRQLAAFNIRESWQRRTGAFAGTNGRRTRRGRYHLSTDRLKLAPALIFNMVLCAWGTGHRHGRQRCCCSCRTFLLATLTSSRYSGCCTIPVRLTRVEMPTHEADTTASWWRPTSVNRGSMWRRLIDSYTIQRRRRRRTTSCWQMLRCIVWVCLSKRYDSWIVVFVAVEIHNTTTLTTTGTTVYCKQNASQNGLERH